MADFSGFWTTGAPGTGDQIASYNQAYWSTALRIMGACNGYDGVAPGYNMGLAGTVTGANTVAIDTGLGLVDGKWYENYNSQNVNIPSATVGHYRIDRIVLLADWATFQVSVIRMANPNQDVPAETLAAHGWATTGTTYAILLYQAKVDYPGTVILTDERDWAGPLVDGTTIDLENGVIKIKTAGVDSAQIAAGAIDTAHIGNLQVTTGLINDLAVTAGKIGALAVETAKINDLAVTAGKIGALAVETAKINDLGVTTGKINDLAVTEGKLGALAVTEGKIGALAVTSGKIGADAVIAGKIADGAVDTTASLVNDIVDDTKVGDRVPALANRQGGSATEWATYGTNNYTPAAVRIQCGMIRWTGSGIAGDITITYPVAFGYKPIIVPVAIGVMFGRIITNVESTSAAAGKIYWTDYTGATQTAIDFFWIAVGPE
jgi:hypothetical protein